MYYCNVCCLKVASIQSLHCKNNWTSYNLEHTIQFLTNLMVMIFYSLTCNTALTHIVSPLQVIHITKHSNRTFTNTT